MIPLNVLLGIFVTHHVGDFMMQSHYCATNKWQSTTALTTHIASYAATLLLFIAVVFCCYMPLPGIESLPIFGKLMTWWAINVAMHFITDYYTSKWTHKLAEAARVNEYRWHNFFVAINCDQMIHYATLIFTWYAIIICS